MPNVFRIAGKILRVAGLVARSIACCCAVVCVDICTGTRPTTFDFQVPHELFFLEDDGCSYDTGTGLSPYGGNFELQILGGLLGEEDDCYWYFCDDDPCYSGKKFVWTFTFNGTNYEATLYYGVEAETCDAAEIISLLAGGTVGVDFAGFDTFSKAGPGEDIDCCTIDFSSGAGGNGLFHDTSAGDHYVTLTETYYIGFEANC